MFFLISKEEQYLIHYKSSLDVIINGELKRVKNS